MNCIFKQQWNQPIFLYYYFFILFYLFIVIFQILLFYLTNCFV